MNLSIWFIVWVVPLISVHLGESSDSVHNAATVLDTCTEGECEAGYYKEMCSDNNIVCAKCPPHTYTAISNKRFACVPCDLCDEQADQKVISTCQSDKNTVCGCKNGYYNETTFLGLRCEKCSKCNCAQCECRDECIGLTTTTVSTQSPDPCKPGSYKTENGECQRCENDHCENKACQPLCHIPEKLQVPVWVPVIVVTSLLMGLQGLVLVYCARRRKCWRIWGEKTKLPGHRINTTDTLPIANAPLPSQPCEQLNIPLSPVLNMPAVIAVTPAKPSVGVPETMQAQHRFNVDWSSLVSPLLINRDTIPKLEAPKESWPAPVLYTIIKEVPVRRWKEFLRRLTVSDDQMERVEMEAGPSYLERQYQMLRLWSQGGGAELENVYAALRLMDLSGCAQELQDKLEQPQGDDEGWTV